MSTRVKDENVHHLNNPVLLRNRHQIVCCGNLAMMLTFSIQWFLHSHWWCDCMQCCKTVTCHWDTTCPSMFFPPLRCDTQQTHAEQNALNQWFASGFAVTLWKCVLNQLADLSLQKRNILPVEPKSKKLISLIKNQQWVGLNDELQANAATV